MADEKKPGPPRVTDPATGMETAPKPMLVVFHGTQPIPGPDGSMMEVVLFKVWEPDDWTKPENFGDPEAGSHMAGRDYRGESVPVLLASMPIMVKAPQPKILRASSMPPHDRRPRA